MILTISEARTLIEQAMTSVGHSDEQAAVIADHLIDSELRGLGFGGLPRALSVLERIAETKTARQDMRIVRETPVSATIDGGDQVGYLVGRRATEIAIDKAGTAGVAVVGAFNTWYTGMFSYYLEMVTAAGFVGMIAGSSVQQVAPHGGSEARFGTNPIAFGFPTDDEPVIWDCGTSNLMYGEAVLHRRLGQPLADGLAFDQHGNHTVDPHAALDGGAFTVWGGHKGSGLALVVQILGMLAGAAAAPIGMSDVGFFILALDPGTLTDARDFTRRVSEYAQSVRATRPLHPNRPVRVPFDRSITERRGRRNANVIDVPTEVHEGLRRFAAAPATSGSPSLRSST